MENTWKKIDNVWKLHSTPRVKRNMQQEFLGNINTPNVAILYMPVHNKGDIYEWYRIFKDAHLYKDINIPLSTNPADDDRRHIDNIGHGIGITMYADKDKAKTIEAWYPNLIKVKAVSTSNEYKYDFIEIVSGSTTVNKLLRTSVDYVEDIQIPNNKYPNLKIDGEIIHDGELVLLKDQYVEELIRIGSAYYNITDITHRNNTDQIITITIDVNEIPKYHNLFKENSKAVIGILNEIYYINITGVEIVDDTSGIKIIIYLDENDIENNNVDVDDIEWIADINNGEYIIYNDYRYLNGVYKYENDELTNHKNMEIPEKVYNQLVYAYQGKQNMNNVYYLRRVEKKDSQYYTQYPTISNDEKSPLLYSLGNPGLIECSVNYDVALITNNELNNGLPCEVFNVNFDYIPHPEPNPTQPYFDVDDAIFRLFYTDYDMARKLQMKTNIGPADYTLEDDDLILYDYVDAGENDYPTLTFPIVNNDYNPLYLYREEKGFLPMTEISFIPYDITSFDNNKFAGIDINLMPGVYDKIELLGIINVADTLPPSTPPLTEYLTHIKITATNNITNDIEFILDDTILVTNVNNTGTDFILDIENEFDKNIYLELSTLVGNNDYDVEWSLHFLNFYPIYPTPNHLTLLIPNMYTVEDNLNELIKAINSTIVGQIYDFGFNEKMLVSYDSGGNETYTNTGFYLKLNKIRNNFNKYIYNDLKQEIEIDLLLLGSTQSSNIITGFYEVYDSNYTMVRYLTDYMSYVNTYPFETRIGKVLNINTNETVPNYLEIIDYGSSGDGSTKIRYGKSHKDYLLKNIKNNSYCKINSIENFIYTNKYDYEKEIGEIIIAQDISRFAPSVTFDPQYNISELSVILTETFDTYNNIANYADSSNEGNYKIMKPSTYSIANDIINAREDFPDLSGVVYKEFNRPTYTFFKRDKKFEFDDDSIIEVEEIKTIIPAGVTTASFDDKYIVGIDIIDFGGSYPLGTLFIFNDGVGNVLNGIYEVVTIENSIIGKIYLKKLPISTNVYYYELSSPNTLYKLIYNTNMHEMLSSEIYLIETKFSKKMDPRLNITFKRFAFLGVDNDYQPFKNINHTSDTTEIEENVVSIVSGINTQNNIRFIDGLSYENIINDYVGQGQFAWILHENVITENAVVGKQIDPITGEDRLVWYTGTWVDGVWCDGIWIQGEWINGTWVNGERYSYGISDYVSTVVINYSTIVETLSLWHTGIWVNGENHSGIMEYVFWKNGKMIGGTIQDGIWDNGEMSGGIIEHIVWHTGVLIGGEIQTGLWYSGFMGGGQFGTGAKITEEGPGSPLSVKYSDRAIMFAAKITGGIITTKYNEHTATIIYAAEFSGLLDSGTIIMAKFNSNAIIDDGLIIGGYYLTSISNNIANNYKELELNPEQWDASLGLDTLTGYVPNTAHNINQFIDKVTVMASKTNNTTVIEFPDDLYNALLPFTNNVVYNVVNNDITNTILNISPVFDINETNIYSTGNGRPYVTCIMDKPLTINKGIFKKIVGHGITFNNSVLIETLLFDCVVN